MAWPLLGHARRYSFLTATDAIVGDIRNGSKADLRPDLCMGGKHIFAHCGTSVIYGGCALSLQQL
jgi:hypothetical protein